MAVGENIKRLRERAGISQGELARRLHISQAAVWYFEHGRKIPGLKLAADIAETFGVSVDELLNKEE